MRSKEIRGAARASCAALLLSVVCAAGARAQSVGWVGARQGQAGKDLNAVYFADSKRGWVAGDGGLVLHTEDGGRTWARQNIGTGENVGDIYFRDREDGYLLAVNQIFTTEDGGQTWKTSARFLAQTFGGAQPELYSVRFTGKKRGWIVGSLSRGDNVVDSLVLYTADGGATWALQNSGTDATLYHVDFRDDERGWAVGERGTILRTEDGGATWRVTGAPVRSTLLSVTFVSKDEGWIAGRGGVILRSDDGGQTWLRQETNTRQNLYALFFDKKTGWTVGGDGLVLRYER
jgi:photosystem II stability/assembly factor-like uncharacterized protein